MPLLARTVRKRHGPSGRASRVSWPRRRRGDECRGRRRSLQRLGRAGDARLERFVDPAATFLEVAHERERTIERWAARFAPASCLLGARPQRLIGFRWNEVAVDFPVDGDAHGALRSLQSLEERGQGASDDGQRQLPGSRWAPSLHSVHLTFTRLMDKPEVRYPAI